LKIINLIQEDYHEENKIIKDSNLQYKEIIIELYSQYINISSIKFIR